MHRVELVNRSAAEVVVIFLILSAFAFSQLLMFFISFYKRRSLIRKIRGLPSAISRPLLVGLKVSPTPLLHLFLFALCIFAICKYHNQGFVAVEYDSQKVAFLYKTRFKPIILNRLDINDIILEERRARNKISMLITDKNGKIYKSSSSRSKEEGQKIRKAHLTLKEIFSADDNSGG